jgi:hypothetical protein
MIWKMIAEVTDEGFETMALRISIMTDEGQKFGAKVPLHEIASEGWAANNEGIFRAAMAKATDSLIRTMQKKCPRCGSPDPKLHPAIQFEGEVQECRHPWHN